MALVTTTLSSAVAATDTSIVVASATSVSAGIQVLVDGELMKVTKGYVAASTTVPVLRGQGGTTVGAHPTSAKVVHGAASDSEWGAQPVQTVAQFLYAGRARTVNSYSASGAITLPLPGGDTIAFLNGTSVLAMTVADPSDGMNGSMLWIASNGAAAHTVTFASGLSGAGSSYDVLTVNATAPVLLGPFVAVNSLWQCAVAVPMAGTVTNVTATLA